MLECRDDDLLLASIKYGLRARHNASTGDIDLEAGGARLTGPATGVYLKAGNGEYIISSEGRVIRERNPCIALVKTYNMASDMLRKRYNGAVTRSLVTLNNYRPSNRCVEWMAALHNTSRALARIYCKLAPLAARLYEILLEAVADRAPERVPDVYYGVQRLDEQVKLIEGLRKAIPGDPEILHSRLLHVALESIADVRMWPLLAASYHAGLTIGPGSIRGDASLLSSIIAGELSWLLRASRDRPGKPLPELVEGITVPVRYEVDEEITGGVLYISSPATGRCRYPCLTIAEKGAGLLYAVYSSHEDMGGLLYEIPGGPPVVLLYRANGIGRVAVPKCRGAYEALEAALTVKASEVDASNLL
ncbi:MAG: hypothetical protein GSR73_03260 [Desulfurococcales archaeon]|nr:hypothetical protein [Desulfurococcales archaeon]